MDTERYRTGRKRIWAAIVDGIVFMPLLLLEQWIYRRSDNIVLLFSWATFVAFAPLVYSVVLHYKNGQTIGKWVAGIKVLDISETRTLTIRQSIYRDGFFLVVALAGFINYGFLLISTDDSYGILTGYSGFSDNPIFWWTLIELITMFTNNRRRALHDFIAKSIVVRAENRS